MKYWILISKAERWYSGNEGYGDDLKTLYEYDNYVQNYRNLKEGDIVFIRDKFELKGIAKIVSIKVKHGTKKGLKCPNCQSSEVYGRKETLYKYRCKKCEGEFDNPKIIEKPATIYTAFYGKTFHNTPAIEYKLLKNYQNTNSNQLSINGFDADRFIKEMEPLFPILFTIVNLLKNDEIHISPFLSGTNAILQEQFNLINDDNRIRSLRLICERRGQPAFRNKLIEIYGSQCLITGCSDLAVLEAAYIYPYKGDKDNHTGNGLLLRSDIHLLFDQNLIGIEPESLKINISDFLQDPNYKAIAGSTLRVTNFRPSLDALNYRWDIYKTTSQNVYGID